MEIRVLQRSSAFNLKVSGDQVRFQGITILA
jgi:hypothetical protein